MPFRRMLRTSDEHINASTAMISGCIDVSIERQLCEVRYEFTQFGRRTIFTPLNACVSIA